ncbi:hypothetical protein [Olivibacter jilunii]|uniref:hypothetical protein n=1 Tax=Olivibacter jilunii TaxID=985016 RepID=UPI00103131FA|nr:hypothetical protein [Olivibacter jilunii]
MKNELNLLEGFVLNELFPALVHHQEVSEEIYDDRLNYIRQCDVILKERVMDLLVSSEDDQVITRLIRAAHNRIVYLSDQLYPQQADLPDLTAESLPENRNMGILRLSLLTQEMISAFLLFLENTCSAYLEMEAKYADYRLRLMHDEIRPILTRLSKRLRRNHIEPELTETLISYLLNFPRQERNLSYRHVDYHGKLFRGLERMQKKWPVNQWSDRLWQLILYFNFNKEPVLRYAGSRVKEISEKADSISEAKERLLFRLKETRQAEQNPAWSYDPDRTSVKDHLILQIEEELNYLQEQEDEQVKILSRDKEAFFIIDLTVKQINLWTTINVAINRIPYHSPLHVIRVLRSFLRTTRTGPISYESARKKTTDFDPPTVQGLHRYLTEQLAELEKSYGHMLLALLFTSPFTTF